jgi:DNA-binding MarR family transcriptional regulator
MPAMDVADDSAKPLGKVLDFMRLIWALDHGLQSLSKRMQNSIGLTGPQRVALRVLGRRPGISAGALAEVLRLHPSTLTGILHRLERRGLVRRTDDPEDRRRVHLALTPRGRRLDVPVPGTVESVVERVLARIPTARVRPAAELLATVAAALLEEPASASRRRAHAAKERTRHAVTD